jgi:hypothetical protein
MTRTEFVRRFVLMEIADDYENLEHIRTTVARDGSRCGMTISDTEIFRALADLIEAGLAKAYRLSGTAPAEVIPGVPRPREIEDVHTYFWATSDGGDLVVSDREWWPFDDIGELREDWLPPVD